MKQMRHCYLQVSAADQNKLKQSGLVHNTKKITFEQKKVATKGKTGSC